MKRWDDSVDLFDPVERLYYGFSFGGGALWDEVADGCDDYVYCSIGRELGGDDDGGQLDFSRCRSRYDGDIFNALPDAMEFLGLNECVVKRLRVVN